MAQEGVPAMAPGTILKGQYSVEKKLGEGGFGAVYKVKDLQSGKLYAMKVEGIREPIQVLKMEVVVLRELASQGKIHVCRILNQGRTGDVNFVIMTLVGQSLQDLKKACNNKFSLSSALRLGIQCLEALEDLHGIGYLHRDVKPGNFAVGREEENEHRNVIILDFGMARQFRKPNGELRTPRQAAGFRGTVRYAPINCHKFQELARKDDLETWFYQQVEFTVGRLPWWDLNDDIKLVLQRKEQSRLDGSLCRGCPDEYTKIIGYIDSLSYTDTPEYERIRTFMKKMMTIKGFQDADPYDWERKAPPAFPQPGFPGGARPGARPATPDAWGF